MADEGELSVKCSQQHTVELQPTGVIELKPGMPPDPDPALTGALASINPALDLMKSLKDIHIRQAFDSLEVETGWRRSNKFYIYSEKELIMEGEEVMHCCTRQMLGNRRPFIINMTLLDGQEVIQLRRPFRCKGAYCCCCMQELTIECPPGKTVGYAKEKYSCCHPQYVVEDASNTPIFDITGINRCKLTLSCTCRYINFKIKYCGDGSEVGEIAKRWPDWRETGSDSNFVLKLPQDLDVQMKTLLLGSSFLVAFLYFEDTIRKSLMQRSLGCVLVPPTSDLSEL